MITDEQILDIARQSGATDEIGNHATAIFCFTQSELLEFSKKIAGKCADLLDDGDGAMSSIAENTWKNICRDAIKDHFGIPK